MRKSYGLFFCVGHIRIEPRRDPDLPDPVIELSHAFKAPLKRPFIHPIQRIKMHSNAKMRFFYPVTLTPCEDLSGVFPCLCGPDASPFPPRQGRGGGADAHTLYLIRPVRYHRTLCQRKIKMIKMVSC